jgi:hypothetical protein
MFQNSHYIAPVCARGRHGSKWPLAILDYTTVQRPQPHRGTAWSFLLLYGATLVQEDVHDADEGKFEQEIDLHPSPGWVPAAVEAVRRMSAQAMVAHAALQTVGRSPDGELLF